MVPLSRNNQNFCIIGDVSSQTQVIPSPSPSQQHLYTLTPRQFTKVYLSLLSCTPSTWLTKSNKYVTSLKNRLFLYPASTSPRLENFLRMIEFCCFSEQLIQYFTTVAGSNTLPETFPLVPSWTLPKMSKTYDYKFKLILCGDSSVGKSSLIHHFLYKRVGGATPEPGKHTYVSCRVLRQLRVYVTCICVLNVCYLSLKFMYAEINPVSFLASM